MYCMNNEHIKTYKIKQQFISSSDTIVGSTSHEGHIYKINESNRQVTVL